MSKKNNHKKNFKRQSKGFVDKTDYLKGFEKFDIPRLELEPHEVKKMFPAQGENISIVFNNELKTKEIGGPKKVIVVGNGNVGSAYLNSLWEAALPKYDVSVFGPPKIFGTAGEIESEDLYKKLWEQKTAFTPKEFMPLNYFIENFSFVKQPDGSAMKFSDHQIKEIEWWKKMSETHVPELMKMRSGTKIVWRLRKEEE